ncbi:MAG: hypothetical protein AB7K24_03600 [Gemmataceae bacterium]
MSDNNHDDQVSVNWPVVMMVGGLGLFMFLSVIGTLAWFMLGGTV